MRLHRCSFCGNSEIIDTYGAIAPERESHMAAKKAAKKAAARKPAKRSITKSNVENPIESEAT